MERGSGARRSHDGVRQLACELSEEARERGVGFVDAPCPAARPARRTASSVMGGGESADVEKAKPSFDVYARKLAALIGGPGCGQLTKMVNQICIVGLAQALAEGLAFANATGSTGKGHRGHLQGRGPVMADGKPRWKPMSELKAEGFGFAIEWMRKDMGICLAAGEAEQREPAGHGAGGPVLRAPGGARRQALGQHCRADPAAAQGLVNWGQINFIGLHQPFRRLIVKRGMAFALMPPYG